MRALAVVPVSLAILATMSADLRAQVMDDDIYTYISFDQLEYVPGGAAEPVEYEGQMWIGGDYDRVWLKTRGEQSTLSTEGLIEGQALYSRAITPFWNAQVGGRVDHRYGAGPNDTRALLALGLEGLAPYWFEVETFLFVSHEGDLSARAEATYDLFFTQRLILQPALELNAAVQDVSAFGVGSGLNDLELEARMRYEIAREFAPYLGVSWVRRFGETADLARLGGVAVSDASLVAGLRWWY